MSPIFILGALFVVICAVAAAWPFQHATAQFSQSTPALTRLSIPETYQGRTVQLDAWLSTPRGSGPFATVILAHGCNGVDPNKASSAWPSMTKWAEWLNQQGYAALILDSFTPRGVRGVCGGAMGDENARQLFKVIPVDVRALDMYVAAEYLAKMPQIKPQSFGAIGFSHGGAAVVRAAAADNTAAEQGRAALAARRGRIAAFVGMYPGCRASIRSNFVAPLLILIGTDDVRTPAEICENLASSPRSAGSSPVTIKVYPGATHSFDVEESRRRTRMGDIMEYSATATADAHMRIKNFFGQYLTGREGAISAR